MAMNKLSAMKWLVVLAVALSSPLVDAKPLGFDGARHLLSRTGFGASEAEIEAYAKLSREQAVSKLLDGAVTVAVTAAPAFVDDPITPPRQVKAMAEEERKEFRQARAREAVEMRAWWLREMTVTPSPLTEKMTLFWHNHFATSQQKVRANQIMYRQNVLLRRHARGNFGLLLHAVAKDPAMLIYLDNASNRKGQANENFAREVMELFTLGEGNYSERDVKEAARSFTGWSVERDSGRFLWRGGMHDDGVKTVLGRSGNFDGDAVLDLLLQQPQTAEFIAAKLWQEFISPQPEEREVKRLGALFRRSGYEIKPLIFALLTCDAFYAPQYRGTLVKSPVELVVGTLRLFAVEANDLRPAALTVAYLGQNLFAPPNVKGWAGGDAWINSVTLLGRKHFLDRLFPDSAPSGSTFEITDKRMPATAAVLAQGADNRQAKLAARVDRGIQAMHFDASQWLGQFGDAASGKRIERLVLAVPARERAGDLNGAALIRSLVLDPAYQLK
jgi:uncharacterized protein (DUF1800 family)